MVQNPSLLESRSLKAAHVFCRKEYVLISVDLFLDLNMVV